jgi:hypothetical protein
MNWDHESVFQALAQRDTDEVTKTKDFYFVAIFSPQRPQCAHLYSPKSKRFSDFPLHLHPGKESWNPEQYLKILKSIGEIKIHGDIERPASDRWIRCKIDVWTAFARGLGLA